MEAEFVPSEHARAVVASIAAARQRAMESAGAERQDEAAYWEALFEANAAEVLAAQSSVSLPSGYVVRYRFYEARRGDLLVRPFVARADTDVAGVRRVLDWHPAPDSCSALEAARATQDRDLLYRHFRFPRTAAGVFDYWLVMQEIWASQRWAHSRLISSADEFAQTVSQPGWDVIHPVQACAPAVVLGDQAARLAVLVECPLERCAISLQQVDVDADQALRYAEPVLVASGPRGYLS